MSVSLPVFKELQTVHKPLAMLILAGDEKPIDRLQCGDRGGGEESETGVSCNLRADFTVGK